MCFVSYFMIERNPFVIVQQNQRSAALLDKNKSKNLLNLWYTRLSIRLQTNHVVLLRCIMMNFECNIYAVLPEVLYYLLCHQNWILLPIYIYLISSQMFVNKLKLTIQQYIYFKNFLTYLVMFVLFFSNKYNTILFD